MFGQAVVWGNRSPENDSPVALSSLVDSDTQKLDSYSLQEHIVTAVAWDSSHVRHFGVPPEAGH